MSEYRHFIAYIYEYESGIKKKNAGFVKVNIRNGIARMQIKFQTGKKENSEYQIYGFFHEESWVYGIAIGEIRTKNGTAEGSLLVKESILEEQGHTFPELSGLWIQKMETTKADIFFMTVWDEKPVNWEAFVTELPQKEENEAEQITPVSEIEVQQMQEEGLQVENPHEESHQENSLQKRWIRFQYHYPHMTPFEDDEIVECIRITPKDIAFLGEKEREFCISPFVQQKYMKYQHLMLGLHKNGRYILAVPGLNRNIQDRNLAAMYGFPEYKAGSDEMTGYWYHFL